MRDGNAVVLSTRIDTLRGTFLCTSFCSTLQAFNSYLIQVALGGLCVRRIEREFVFSAQTQTEIFFLYVFVCLKINIKGVLNIYKLNKYKNKVLNIL